MPDKDLTPERVEIVLGKFESLEYSHEDVLLGTTKHRDGNSVFDEVRLDLETIKSAFVALLAAWGEIEKYEALEKEFLPNNLTAKIWRQKYIGKIEQFRLLVEKMKPQPTILFDNAFWESPTGKYIWEREIRLTGTESGFMAERNEWRGFGETPTDAIVALFGEIAKDKG